MSIAFPDFALIALLVFVFLLGAALGSFLCCQARRLRRRELKKRSLGSRSVCLHCKKKLAWYENVPIISWLALRGRCRHCHRPIGIAEFLAELGTALAFLIVTIVFLQSITAPPTFGADLFGEFSSHATFPYLRIAHWAIYIATLILAALLIFLAIYDGLYGELPVLFLTLSIICAIMIAILRYWTSFSVMSEFHWGPIVLTLISAAILGGTYLLLYLISKGRWVGSGDWLLALAIGIALSSPWLSLMELLVANLLATIIMLPSAIKHTSNKIYFGPFLVSAFVIVYVLSIPLMNILPMH